MAAPDRLSALLKINKWQRAHAGSALGRVYHLAHLFETLQRDHPAVVDAVLPYFPIALVTAIEVYFRVTIAELVDHGAPFVDRAETLAKSIKFDLAMIRLLQGRMVSLGEIIAQAPPLQSLTAICSAMEALTGEAFLPALGGTRDRWKVEIEKKSNKPIIADIDVLARDITALMKTRHIVAHEIRHKLPFSVGDVGRFIAAAQVFLDAAFWYVNSKTAPNEPLQQQPMNEAAWKRAQERDRELQTALLQAREAINADRAPEFDAAQAAWEQYRDAVAEFGASEYRGGSASPYAGAIAYEEITKKRIEDVRILTEQNLNDPREF